MILELTPEQEAELQRIADFEGKTPQQLLLDAAFSRVEEDREICQILDERLKEAELGVFVEHADVKARYQKLLARR